MAAACNLPSSWYKKWWTEYIQGTLQQLTYTFTATSVTVSDSPTTESMFEVENDLQYVLIIENVYALAYFIPVFCRNLALWNGQSWLHISLFFFGATGNKPSNEKMCWSSFCRYYWGRYVIQGKCSRYLKQICFSTSWLEILFLSIYNSWLLINKLFSIWN